MKIGIANDHRGYHMKEFLKIYLDKLGYEIIDYGCDSEDPVDYPKYAFMVGEAIRDKKIDFGILICGSGIGMSIACNKVKGVRCAKVSDEEEAKITRIDNDSNVIAMSYHIGNEQAENIVYAFLHTKFSDLERHRRRVEMIDNYFNDN